MDSDLDGSLLAPPHQPQLQLVILTLETTEHHLRQQCMQNHASHLQISFYSFWSLLFSKNKNFNA